MGYDDSQNIEEIPGTGIGEQDSLLGKIRRFSALSAMEDPEEPPPDSRVDDEKHGASGGPSGPDATAASINPSAAPKPAAIQPGAPPNGGYQDDPQEKAHLSDLIAQRQALLNPAPKPSLKHRILASIIKIAPTAIAAGVGGGAAASGAAAGTMGTINQEREDRQKQELLRNQRAQALGQQIETAQGRMDTQRYQEGSQNRLFTNQNALLDKRLQAQKDEEDMREGARQELSERTQKHQDELYDKRAGDESDRLDRRLKDSDERQGKMFANENKMQDKRLAAQVAMFNRKESAKDEALSPSAQKIIMQTEPTIEQVDRLLDTLEPVKNDNTPFTSLAARIRYKAGLGSSEDDPAGSLQRQIGELEMDRVIGAARLLQGSSKAYQALMLAREHTPNPWVDSKKLLYEKLTSMRSNLQGVADDARKYGAKSGKTPPGVGPRTQRTAPAGAPAAAAGGTVIRYDAQGNRVQ